MKCRFLIDDRCLCGVAKAFETNPLDETCRCCENYEGIPRGLGDVVHSITTVTGIAKAVDTVTGGCGGCAARRAALNAAIPFSDTPKKE